MNILDRVKESRRRKTVTHKASEYFDLLDGYRPVFSSFRGSIYEAVQTRAAINANATHRSKLSIEIIGDKYKDLSRVINVRPNPWQTTSQFLSKISTILDCENTCIIIPLYDSIYPDHIVGFFPVHANTAEVVEDGGEVYLKYTHNGHVHAIEYDRAGVVTKMSYNNEIFGDSNAALFPTLDLSEIHNQSVKEAVKASATIRFLVKLTNTFRDGDLRKERKRFIDENLNAENGGVMLIDKKYDDVKQLESTPLIVEPEQMQLIDQNVQDYYAINRDIIQNKFDSETWAAYYEGNTEPFAVQVSQVLTAMLFSAADIARGCMVYLSANRLQYASNKEKINIVSSLFDRGLLSTNQGLDIFNLPPVDDGDKRYIRKDYIDLSLLGAELNIPDIGVKDEDKDPAHKNDDDKDDDEEDEDDAD